MGAAGGHARRRTVVAPGDFVRILPREPFVGGKEDAADKKRLGIYFQIGVQPRVQAREIVLRVGGPGEAEVDVVNLDAGAEEIVVVVGARLVGGGRHLAGRLAIDEKSRHAVEQLDFGDQGGSGLGLQGESKQQAK